MKAIAAVGCLFLAACAVPAQVVVQHQLVKPNIAPELLQPEPAPAAPKGKMQSDAAGLIIDLDAALSRANAKIEAIRKAVEAIPEGNGG